MKPRVFGVATAAMFGVLTFAVILAAQPPGGPPGGPGDFGKGGKGGGFGFGPPGGQDRKLVEKFDKDKNGWLNAEERVAAREEAKKGGRPGGGFMKGGFGKGGKQEPPKPGPTVKPEDVKPVSAPLYEPTVLRTLFLEFENKDWEMELQDFHGTDVEVPCTLTVDGKTYKTVGVHFRGMSSYGGVSAGFKRSLNLSLDLADAKQRLAGYKTLNLLNNHEDASALGTVLYSHIARQYMPAPKANLVKVVINGESWGIYTNVQQFDKVFTKEAFKTDKGTRWKVRGNPGGDGGLRYLGDDVAQYKQRYEIKSNDDAKAWKALINFCKVLNETPPDKLEAALKPIADIDGLLWFLALDVALINGDGYWTRASDYSIFLDEKGKFHFLPADMNEAFHPPMGPGMGGMVFRMPATGEILPPFLQDMMQLTAEQKKAIAELQKDADGKLDKILTEEQRKQLKELKAAPPNPFGPPGGPGAARAAGPPPENLEVVTFAFAQPPGGPGGFVGGPPGGPGGGRNMDLDPLVGLTNARMPLRSKVLAVPELRKRYLEHVKTIAQDSLDWKKLGPLVAQYRKLVEKEIEADTRKLESFEAFKRTTANEAAVGGGREMPLRTFADQRRKYLLDYKEPAAK